MNTNPALAVFLGCVWGAVSLSACIGQVGAPGSAVDSDPGRPPGGSPPAGAPLPALAEACKTPTVGPARLWRLSRDQLRESIKTALDLDVTAAQLAAFNDSAGRLFRNEVDSLPVRKTDASSWSVSAADVARAAVPAVKKAAVCPDLTAAACAPSFADAYGAKLFRRPLRVEEKLRYAKLYSDTLVDPAGGGGDGAAEATLSAMLQSPFFLYRTELGTPVPGRTGLARLSGHELASALSYTLWQTSPDDELGRAARMGELDGTDGVRKQAARMVDDARFASFYGALVADLTRASQMSSREGADQVANSATVMGWMQTELDDFIKAVVMEKPTLDELLTRNRISIAGELASFRNLGTAKGAALVEVTLPAAVSGLFSLGAIAFANSGTDHPSPVKRGLMVRDHLLCSPIPPPPDDVKMQFAPLAGDVVTNRQRYEKTMSPPLCNSCHRLFNPMGYAFEALDEVGRYRTEDGGSAVDLSGAVVETRDANVTFGNLAELAKGLAGSQQVSECFALQGFRFVSGRPETPGDLCYVRQAADAFARAGKNLKTLAVELVTSDSFALRTVDK